MPELGVEANNWGTYDVCPHASVTNDNGNLQSWVVYAGGPAAASALMQYTASYTYDAVNRLTGVSETGYARGFNYDAFGNAWVTGPNGMVFCKRTGQFRAHGDASPTALMSRSLGRRISVPATTH